MIVFGDFTEDGYAALIGDVVGSRRRGRRASLQRDLTKILDRLNRELRPALAAPLALTAGDEIQGLFRRPEAVIDVVTHIAEKFPAPLVYGLGFGPLSTDLGPDPALLDGPCFHFARVALGQAQEDDGWVVARGFGEPVDGIVTTIFLLMHEIRSGWTEIQTAHVREARMMAQKDVAARFGKAESTVSESLKAAGFKAIQSGEEALRNCLVNFAHKGELTQHSVKEPKQARRENKSASRASRPPRKGPLR